MEQVINRYNLNKEFVAQGTLIIDHKSQLTTLRYSDTEIDESVSELYHPLKALESLRVVLEQKHKSLIACTGCRNDSAYRATGGNGTYILIHGRPGTERAGLFEPTDEISKLCTVQEHKIAYKKWCDSLRG